MINFFTFILLASAFVIGYVVGCLAMFGYLKKEIDYRDEIVTGLRAATLRMANENVSMASDEKNLNK